VSANYSEIQNILSEEKLGKPLFCWMIATVYDNEEKELLFGRHKKDYLGEMFLYQQFIHNVILGKPRDVVEKDFVEWLEKSKDEKKMLRVVAFLKNDRPYLTKEKIEDYLNELGLKTTYNY
jgi:hypothetical protein